jgi:hypothetical protein
MYHLVSTRAVTEKVTQPPNSAFNLSLDPETALAFHDETLPTLRKLHKKPPIFLPFRKSAAVKSAPRGKMDNIIEAIELQIERKHFYVELRENERGKFLRIIEEAHGRRNSIIVPSTGVDEFTAAISEVLTNNGSAPV